MKKLCLLSLIFIVFSFFKSAYAEIINGYDAEIIQASKNITNLESLREETLNKADQHFINKDIRSLHLLVKKLSKNQRKTAYLINQLKVIDPKLYYQINTIRDLEGNETDVYIKVVDDLKWNFLGATNVAQSDKNPHIYHSLYGDTTVNVMLTFPSKAIALKVLVHELGHVKYQVPNLASYMVFYRKSYFGKNYNSRIYGHLEYDPSHHSVKETLKAFRQKQTVVKQYAKQQRKTANTLVNYR
ncbi:hypothetical protein [Chondrinema litorale]|uniref:hypothetical protein n=1 Tax=Chondrinema litorale TaxID=2994555 RepID=UPI0025438ABE|nr:hypothetical protein [Chondrinema litorale]UZR97673.1 hypothetical protein OQ292_28110 [Chondrinema litorale]